MLREIFGMAILCVCFNANALFLDSISLSGAQCKISIPDTATCFASVEHPCGTYYHFNYNYEKKASSRYKYYSLITVEYKPAANCTLYIRQFYLNTYRDTSAMIACDSLSTFHFNRTDRFDSARTSIEWEYPLPTKRLITPYYSMHDDILKFVLKSAVDSTVLYFSRSQPRLSPVSTGKTTIARKLNVSNNAYTISGRLVGSIDNLPPVYITRDVVRVNTRHRMFF